MKIEHARASLTPIENAYFHIDDGFAVVPIPFGEKGPKIPEWEKLRITEETVGAYFSDAPMNMGVILGAASGGLQDVDLDASEARALAPKLLPPTRTFGRKSNPTSHYFYHAPDLADGDKTKQFRDPVSNKVIVELRSAPSQTVIPGSTHKSGEAVAWDFPIVEIAGASRAELERLVRELAAGALCVRYWPETSDFDESDLSALMLAAALLGFGWSAERVSTFMERIEHPVDAGSIEPDLAQFMKFAESLKPDAVAKLDKVCAKLREWFLGPAAGRVAVAKKRAVGEGADDGQLALSAGSGSGEYLTAPCRGAEPDGQALDDAAAMAAIPMSVRLKRAAGFLLATEPAINGQGGSGQAYGVAVALVRRFALGREEGGRLFREQYNPRCQPPWSEAEIEHKLDDAEMAVDTPLGADLLQDNEREMIEKYRDIVGLSPAGAVAKIEALLAGRTPSGPIEREDFVKKIAKYGAKLPPLAFLDVSVKALEKVGVPKAPGHKAMRATLIETWKELESAGFAHAGDGTLVGEAEAEKLGLKKGAAGGARVPSGTLAAVQIFEELDGYEREGAKGDRELISNFVFTALRQVEKVDGTGMPWLEVRVTGGDGRVVADRWPVPATAWHSKRAFVAALVSGAMKWFGSDDEVIALRGLLYSPDVIVGLPRIRQTEVVGRLDGAVGARRFVRPDGVLAEGGAGSAGGAGTWMAEPDVVYLPVGAGSAVARCMPRGRSTGGDAALPVFDAEVAAAARAVFEALLRLHERSAMLRLVGWFAASAVAGPLRGLGGGFPHANVFGSPGCGKSTLVTRVLWPAFSGVLAGSTALSLSATPYATLRELAATDGIAVFFDELRTDLGERKMSDIFRLLRRLWAGDSESRGRADRSVEILTLTAPVIVAGETRLAGDPALDERTMPCGLDRNWPRANPESKRLLAELARLPLHRVGTWMQARSLAVDVAAELTRSAAVVDIVLGQMGRADVSERVRHGMACVQLGLTMWADACRELGISVGSQVEPEQWLGGYIEDMYGVEVGAGAGSMVTANHGDQALRDWSIMAHLNLIEPDIHYTWIGGKLRFHVAACESARDVWHRSMGKASTSPGAIAIKRSFKENLLSGPSHGYVITVDTRTAMGPGDDDDCKPCVRCVAIDPGLIPDSLHIDAFPKSRNRGWGGARAGAGRKADDGIEGSFDTSGAWRGEKDN